MRRVRNLESVAEAKAIGESMNDDISAEVSDYWMDTYTETVEAGLKLLGPLLEARSVGDGATEGPDFLSGDVRISASDDPWTLVVGGRAAAFNSGATAGALGGIGALFIGFSWFPPVAIAGVIAATCGDCSGASRTPSINRSNGPSATSNSMCRW